MTSPNCERIWIFVTNDLQVGMARPSTCTLSFTVGAVAAWVWSHPAAAIEPGQSLQTKPGVAFGVSAAPLPPGLYMIDDVFNYELKLSGPGTVTTGNVPRGFAPEATGYFLWYPGWSFLGATYSAFAAFPFLAVSVENVLAAGFPGVSFSGVHNTFIAPLRLQWSLGNGFFAQAGVNQGLRGTEWAFFGAGCLTKLCIV